MSFSVTGIRPASLGDAPALAVLYTELGYPAAAAAIERRLPPILANPAQEVFVATDDAGGLVGSVHIAMLTILERDLSAQILGLVVSSAHRRRGIGRALVAVAEEWASAEGCGTVYVRTNVLRPAAPAFYEGIGYINTKTQHAFRKDLPAPPTAGP